MKTLIQHCRLVSPGIDLPEAEILIENGKIGYAGEKKNFPADSVVEAHGLTAVPGFIDIHSHGRSGYDFCDATPEAFQNISAGKLQDGVTSFLCTTLSVSKADLRQVCRTAADTIRNFHDGATLLGMHLEGPFLNPECAGAQNPAHLIPPEIGLIDELNAVCPVCKVTFSPELPGGLELTRELVRRGIMPSGGHTSADYDCFEKNRLAGMTHLTHFLNAMQPMHHMRFGIAGGGMTDADVFTEIICDGIHICEQMLRFIVKNKTPERVMVITDSMRAAAMPDGNYSLGGLPVTVKDGRASLLSGTLAGSTLRFHNGLKKLVSATGLPLSRLIGATSWNQAVSLHIPKRGKLEKGFFADIALLDGNLDPQMTFCEGKLLWKTGA